MLIPFFFACDDPGELGLEVDSENTNVQLTFVDFTLPVSTTLIDSLRAENQSNIVFGSYEDSISGKVTATGYTNYNQKLSATGDLPGTNDRFIDARLIVKITDFKSANVANNQSIAVHTATDTLFKPVVYLSNRFTEYSNESIGDLVFDFNPELDSILEIPLNDEFGGFLFERLRLTNVDSLYRDSLLFSLYHYDPLVIVSNNTSALFSVDLLQDTTGIYIDYQDENGNPSTYIFDMISGNGSDAHYTYIERDRSTTKLSSLVNDYDTFSDPNRAYLNSLAGLYPKIDITPVTDFFNENQEIIINRSELKLGYSNLDGGYINPVDFLYFFFIKENNRINAAGAIGGNGIDKGILTENSYISTLNQTFLTVGRNSESQTYDGITTFFTQILVDNARANADFITQEIVVMPSRSMSLNQTSFINEEVKLRVYYTSLK